MSATMEMTAMKKSQEHGLNEEQERMLLREAARLSRTLHRPNPAIYWMDFGLSVVLGYGALLLAILSAPFALKLAAGVVSVLALYRAASFMHELTHIKPADIPGFRTAWNLLMGVPFMVPSFMYEEVHTLHHARTRYGTAGDPEYLLLASQKPAATFRFLALSLLIPVALYGRYVLLAPLSLLSPKLRKIVVERYSALAINPEFRRPPVTEAVGSIWLPLEIVTSIWAVGSLALVITGVVPFAAYMIFYTVMTAVWFLNQVRTLVAHRWENDGEPITMAAQYLDSVNVPPPGLLPALWAPVGLRYHALHHLLPAVPYHALGEAHRQMLSAMPEGGLYAKANYRSLVGLVGELLRSARANTRQA